MPADQPNWHGQPQSHAPIFVPLAASGLVLVMVGAAIVHTRRNEPMNVAVNLVLIALAVFVARGRFGSYSFASKDIAHTDSELTEDDDARGGVYRTAAD